MPKSKFPRKDFVWSPNLAYVVGLLATDGNLSSDRRHLSLTSSDIQLLDTFRKCLNKAVAITNNPPSSISKKPSYRVQIGDAVLYDWLLRIGLSPNKSLTIGRLDIDEEYFSDFLRGHLDGDGSIIYYKDKYNTYLSPKYIYDRLLVYFLSASKKHILWIRKTIKSLKGISGSFEVWTPGRAAKGHRPIYRLKFSTKEAKILLNWIYYKSDLPCLKRKFAIAKPFLLIN